MKRDIRINGLREMYRSTLFDKAVPRWEKHSIDQGFGGYLTRLDRQRRPLSKVLSLYTEVFATTAVAEYAKISQSKELGQRARE